MAAPGPGGALFYTPEPNERAYYDGLFQAADASRNGQIGGAEAVAFFSRSKLPLEQLKNVWTVADNPPTNILDRPKFAVAVRLIQLLQNGVKGQGSNLAAPPGAMLRPVFLEGISGAVVPMPSAQQQQPQQQHQQQQQPGGPPRGGPPGGPPQQQQQQQNQQQPPPQQQQQQPPAQMNAGGRPPMAPGASPNQGPAAGAGSMALTVQDPYTLTPTERQRYESLFPQYAKEDGFMYGAEAVGLFSKSGLNQTLLRDIWNMADQPVDNKLDKLEFAIAMHLIVCVSKKNLPMPKVLPISLKALKQQQQQQQQQQQPAQEQPQMQQPSAPPAIVPSPSYNSQHPPSIHGEHSVMSETTQPTLQGPPPIVQAGGMGISDAFAGLSTNDDGMGSLPPPSSGFGSLGGGGFGGQASSNEPSFGGGLEQASPTMEPTPAAVPSPPPIHQYNQPNASAGKSAASSIPDAAPKTSESLAESYTMTDASGELVKLKTILQKLQAENISLKAQLGTMSEEEKDVQKQVNATVSEIGELSNRLTTLRAQVLASKSRLLEATAELKAAVEKKGVLKDLIGEAEATKDAIETAYQGLEESVHAAQAPAPQPAPAPAYETDLFGWGGAPTPAPAPAVAAAPSYDSHPEAPPAHGHGGAPNPYAAAAQATAPAPIPYSQPAQSVPAGHHQLETVSDDDSSLEHEEFDANPEQEAEPMFSYDTGHEASANPFGQQAPDPSHGISYEQQVFRSNSPPGPGHNKQSSISSLNFGEVMGGGGPTPQNQFAHQQEAEIPVGYGGGEGIQTTHSMVEINEMKSKAADAEDLARESANTHRQLAANADELRKAADQAEADARQKLADATEKKKGSFMGGGKKKKSMKEATQAKADAEAKKKKFLAAQSQALDAQSVAMETKREAEKLRKEAEQAELDLASAASMQQKQPAPEPAPAPQATNGYQNQGGGGYGHPQHGYGQQPQVPQPPQGQPGYGGYGQPQPAHGGAFNPNVMGQPQGGGIELPSPSAYANPF